MKLHHCGEMYIYYHWTHREFIEAFEEKNNIQDRQKTFLGDGGIVDSE